MLAIQMDRLDFQKLRFEVYNKIFLYEIFVNIKTFFSYLAHGNAVRTQSWKFQIGRSTAYKIISEVCQAIWNAFQPTYLPDMNSEKWSNVADEFYLRWQFPNCIGAIDGKHIKIRCPPNSGSDFYNYKQYFSIVLLAICDARCKFTWVDIGQYGSISDGGVWSRSKFGNDLERGYIDLPPPKNLPLTNIPIHHVFVGDEAFPLKTYLLRPYNRKDLGDAERVLNYRLSRARRIIENAFGILVSRWQILTRTICCTPDNATHMIKAIVCLHNYLTTAEEQYTKLQTRTYCPNDLFDCGNLDHEENDDRTLGSLKDQTVLGNFVDLTRIGANNARKDATQQRNTLRDYFVSELGEREAPWQYRCAFKGLVINDAE
ncbi:PREDICTED: uncharacterized protein LOC105556324 [Vollenhovia emeryi]|uniref:uncharacterized protein LOC105556324 n=1 Tax=Vollenhovia emeryi TaxID=411798 RepID=UPI0005F4F695|nr:PREDICTED: uncharacterized protein LOC105556324 [Vollenhovia emeryi]